MVGIFFYKKNKNNKLNTSKLRRRQQKLKKKNYLYIKEIQMKIIKLYNNKNHVKQICIFFFRRKKN